MSLRRVAFEMSVPRSTIYRWAHDPTDPLPTQRNHLGRLCVGLDALRTWLGLAIEPLVDRPGDEVSNP